MAFINYNCVPVCLVSVEEQKQSWLAMYTYNSVEGEYFDDNPSGYLGVY